MTTIDTDRAEALRRLGEWTAQHAAQIMEALAQTAVVYSDIEPIDSGQRWIARYNEMRALLGADRPAVLTPETLAALAAQPQCYCENNSESCPRCNGHEDAPPAGVLAEDDRRFAAMVERQRRAGEPTCESGTLVMQAFVPGKGDSVMIRRVVSANSRPVYHVFYNGVWTAGPILDAEDAYGAARELGYVPAPDHGPRGD